LIENKNNGRRKERLGCPSTRWETITGNASGEVHRDPWNKGKIVAQKAPFKIKDIRALRVRLQRKAACANSPYSMWDSTANFEVVTLGAQGQGHLPRRAGRLPRDGDAAQGAAPGSIRDHAGHP
jgi:hypothetical protein